MGNDLRGGTYLLPFMTFESQPKPCVNQFDPAILARRKTLLRCSHFHIRITLICVRHQEIVSITVCLYHLHYTEHWDQLSVVRKGSHHKPSERRLQVATLSRSLDRFLGLSTVT